MSQHASHFAMLAGFSNQTSSDARRELLRQVTDAIGQAPDAGAPATVTSLDELLAAVAADYSLEVRSELSRLVASNSNFPRSANNFALDDIDVASHVLIRSRIVNDATLLKVIDKKSESHMMAVTQRQAISPTVSYALVEAGSDQVVVALLSNKGADIGADTFEVVAKRAESSTVLQAPLVRRQDVPIELLNELYTKVEANIRSEILKKFDSVPSDELDKAFQRSRHRLSKRAVNPFEDFDASKRRIDEMTRQNALRPATLVTLMREGPASRTAFMIAFAQMTDVELEMVHRAVVGYDQDIMALLCRGAGFERALYVTLALGLKNPDERSGPSAEELGGLYEQVPVTAAQRAIRFWKVRAAA